MPSSIFGPILYAYAQSRLPPNTSEQLWTAISHKQGLISVAELIDAEAQFEIMAVDPDEDNEIEFDNTNPEKTRDLI